MKNPIQNIERLAKAIEIFSKPTKIQVAANKLHCTERTIYRVIASLEQEGFTFKKLAKGYRIESVPESALDTVYDLYLMFLGIGTGQK